MIVSADTLITAAEWVTAVAGGVLMFCVALGLIVFWPQPDPGRRPLFYRGRHRAPWQLSPRALALWPVQVLAVLVFAWRAGSDEVAT